MNDDLTGRLTLSIRHVYRAAFADYEVRVSRLNERP